MSARITPLPREGLRRSREGANVAGCGVISLLLLSPRSHSPGAAEGGSPHTEQRGHGDLRPMARHSLPAAGSWRGGAGPRMWGTSIFTSIPGFFCNLQNRTRSANILKGRGWEACNCSCRLPGKTK